jgi:hypothetical protein
MKLNKYFITLVFISFLLITSCSNNGMFLGMNQTNVELSEANYNIVATNLVGQSRAGYLFGFSMSLGSSTQTLAVARVEGTGMLYKEAMEDLWKNFEAEHGKTEGRKLALANVRYDSEALNLLVFTGIKVFVRADVVEFTE